MSGDEQPVDVPIVIDPAQAEEIADKLDAGEAVTLEVSGEIAPDLSNQIRWQLDNGEPVTELVDRYGDTEES